MQSSGFLATPGFRASASSADVRGLGNDRLDLALFVSDDPNTTTAAVFTTNDVKAAPLLHAIDCLGNPDTLPRAILVNSGNANACTGSGGLEDAYHCATTLEQAMQLEDGSALVASTGRIGRRLPLDRIIKQIPRLVEQLSDSPQNADDAAQAILTSDTRIKTSHRQLTLRGKTITIGGTTKGAGMIEPNMATMLAFISTDAACSVETANQLLRQAVQDSFNAISVDGDMSTNDSVFFMANSRSSLRIEELDTSEKNQFFDALQSVCRDLAEMIVSDGEKISHVIDLKIQGAPTRDAAEKVARAIGNSILVKSSWYGNDPNWGRLMDAAGYARIGIDPEQVSLYYNDTPVLLLGAQQDELLDSWKAIVSRRRFSIVMDLHLGTESYSLLTTDLTEAYVDFNKSE